MKCIDTHAHIAPDTDFNAIIASMDAADVSHIGIMPRGGAEESDVIDFYLNYPERVLPFYGGSDIQTVLMEGATKRVTPNMRFFQDCREAWWAEWLDEIMAHLESGMRAAPYKGIGEIRLRHYGNGPTIPEKEHDYDFPADSDFMRRLIDLAARLDLPVAIHLEAEAEGEHIAFLGKPAARSTVPAFERLLEHNRGARVIWSHLGRAAPEVIDGMLAVHPNLYTDISDVQPRAHNACGCSTESLEVFAEYTLKHSIVDEDGRLKNEWKPIFERYPDRIMLGTDSMSGKGYGRMYCGLADQLRDVLAELSPPAATKIARDTARKVFRLG